MLPVAARLAAHRPETVDLLATDRGPGVVAGQLELGQVLHQVLGSGAAHMRVALHGHDRKMSVDSVNYINWLVRQGAAFGPHLLLLLRVAGVDLQRVGGHVFELGPPGLGAQGEQFRNQLLHYRVLHVVSHVEDDDVLAGVGKGLGVVAFVMLRLAHLGVELRQVGQLVAPLHGRHAGGTRQGGLLSVGQAVAALVVQLDDLIHVLRHVHQLQGFDRAGTGEALQDQNKGLHLRNTMSSGLLTALDFSQATCFTALGHSLGWQ